VRVLKPAVRAWGTQANYEREPALLALLGACGLPVGRNASAVRDEHGRLVAVVHDHVGGTEANRLRLGPAARVRLASDVAAFLTALHSTPVEEARARGVPDLDLGEQLYRPLVEACLPLVGPRSREWLQRRFERFMAEGGSAFAPRALLHGDLRGDHLLLEDGGRLRGVIDFADALIGDPAFDFAALASAFSLAWVAQTLAAYRGPAADDPDLPRRARFYSEVDALWQVRYGDLVDGGRMRRAGIRRLAARAAADGRPSGR
jgi:aminoglycoside phosphotransferase (APT) family kinase protein